MGNIRFLLALAVVFAHAWPGHALMVGGRNAVQLFYMISGFLISFVLLESRNYSKPRDFYVNRALRLYPTYYVVAVISLIAYLLLDGTFVQTYREMPLAGTIALVLGNLAIIGQDWIMFTGATPEHFGFNPDFHQSAIQVWQGLLVPPAWSLGVEISFYLIAPFVLTRKKLIWVLVLLSVLLRLWIVHLGHGTKDPWTYRFFPTELLFFLAGALSHQYVLPWIRKLGPGRMDRGATTATVFFIALTMLYSFLPIPSGIRTVFLLGSFIVILPFSFIYQRQSRFDRAIGELSYPLYICHYLVVELAFAWFPPHDNGPALITAIGICLVSVAFAWLLNELVGKKVEHLRDRFRRHA